VQNAVIRFDHHDRSTDATLPVTLCDASQQSDAKPPIDSATAKDDFRDGISCSHSQGTFL